MPVADVTHVDRVVLESIAVRAETRVVGVVRGAKRDRVVVDAEGDNATGRPAREFGDVGIVGVEDEGRCAIEVREHGMPALGDGIDLAVAIELVAEEVEEGRDARAEAGEQSGQLRFIDLEHADRAIILGYLTGSIRSRNVGGEQAAFEVGAGPVGQRLEASLREDRGEQVRGGGLSVGAGDGDHTLREAGGERADEVGGDRAGNEAGQCRATTSAQAARGGASGTASEQGGAIAERGHSVTVMQRLSHARW